MNRTKKLKRASHRTHTHTHTHTHTPTECLKLKGLAISRTGKGFPGGAVVKNPSANARNTGLSPGPEGSHMPRSN